MRLLIAILLPFAAFFTIGRPLAGILCLLLQFTIIGTTGTGALEVIIPFMPSVAAATIA